jgi:hypothetical protein
VGQARKMENVGEEIGFESVAPRMGPFLVQDTFGMKIACTILHHTLDHGKWSHGRMLSQPAMPQFDWKEM